MYSVLILDDNKPTAQQIEQTIPWEELGCKVVCVLHDGISGKEAIERLCPDLIITDIEMPGLSGIEMLDLTKKLIPASQIIFISAYEKFDYAQKAIKLQACEYLVKPFTRAKLRSSIEEAISRLDKSRPKGENNAEKQEYSPVMQNILEYIAGKAYGQISLEMVAEHFQMSPSKLGRLLKKELGMGFVDHITKKRIERAKQLLSVPNMRVSEVAGKVGYGDYVTFYKVFTRSEGISPTDYRNNMKLDKDSADEN